MENRISLSFFRPSESSLQFSGFEVGATEELIMTQHVFKRNLRFSNPAGEEVEKRISFSFIRPTDPTYNKAESSLCT